MISERISDDIALQMKILNRVITILMAFLCLFTITFLFSLKLERCKPHEVVCNLTKCDIIKDVRLVLIVHVYRDILSQISNIIQSDIALQQQVHTKYS